MRSPAVAQGGRQSPQRPGRSLMQVWTSPQLSRGASRTLWNGSAGAAVGPSMALPDFSVTYDYRCPYARNAHEHLVTALQAGADWHVDFVPFSLSQAHVEEGEAAVWDDPQHAPDLLAVEASIAVRQVDPERFLGVHLALFAARHDEGRDLRQPDVVRSVLAGQGVDGDGVLRAVAQGGPRLTFRAAHEYAVGSHQVFGVPTFIVGDRAAFARLLVRPQGDPELARSTIERVVGLVADHPEINELKHTSVPR